MWRAPFVLTLLLGLWACVPTSAPQPPTLELTGTWTGTYTWDCGADDLKGRSDLTAELVYGANSPFARGTLSYLGETVEIMYANRCNAQQGSIDKYGSLQCARTDPAGEYLIISHEETENLPYNEFTGRIEGETIIGTILNGNSPILELDDLGCSHPDKHSGTFRLTRSK